MSALTEPRPPERSIRLRLPRPALLTLITTHIVVSVGLLGDSAGFLAVALRRASSDDDAFRQAARELLAMFAITFGIPLSLLALLTGLVLALSTRWGVLRYSWVLAKLALIVSVIVVGATLISPVLRPGEPSDRLLVLGGAWDVAALLAATSLAVVKPGKRRQKRSRRRVSKPDGT